MLYRKAAIFAAIICVCMGCTSSTVVSKDFRSNWPRTIERVWIGPEYWANPMQDWRISAGRLECVTANKGRNVHLLTHQLGKRDGDFQMSVRTGALNKNSSKSNDAWVGFRIGAKTFYNDYRASVNRGRGMHAGITASGKLFIEKARGDRIVGKDSVGLDDIKLCVTSEPSGAAYKVTISACEPQTCRELTSLSAEGIGSDKLEGNIALVCHNMKRWFTDWTVAGSKIDVHPEQTFGPILFAQHTLSKNILKMTAQMAPVGKTESQVVRLQIRRKDSGKWETVAKANIHKLARTATFGIEDWDSSQDIPYRLAYTFTEPDGKTKDHYWGGTIRKDPVAKETIVVAAFTGNNDTAFPNNDIVKNMKVHNPDMLVFTGDQIYEGVAGFGADRRAEILDTACLDYLRKWILFGWAYGDLLRDIPCVCLPDDHDVYQGNIWGAGGRKATGENARIAQDNGGYMMPAEWVKMVERTQTSHLPDPFDPTPVEQGIGVYYCSMNYGGVSFAIVEDRKFKSSPTVMVPDGKVENGSFLNPDFDPATQADVPGAILLGDRQLKFLDRWSADWSDGVWMKVVLSQTLFAAGSTVPKGKTNSAISGLRILNPGEYPPDDVPFADADTNGWPQTGRNEAIRRMRKGFAFHICGDQHLGSTMQYGVDEWRDAGFALCVPALANVWPRRWMPAEYGQNQKSGRPQYTGDYKDGFGNLITLYAASNPVTCKYEPVNLHERSVGYGIVKFNKNNRKITIECWPRYGEPGNPAGPGQYPDWPITINQVDNYGRKAYGYLPTIKVSGITGAVVQVINENSGELIYTLRIKDTTFKPKVFEPGTYTVKVGEPGTAKMKTVSGLGAFSPENKQTVSISF